MPCLTSPPVPLITPANVVLLASPLVKVLAFKVTWLPATPVNVPIVSLLSRFKMPTEPTLTLPVSGMAAPPASDKMPSLTVVVPV